MPVGISWTDMTPAPLRYARFGGFSFEIRFEGDETDSAPFELNIYARGETCHTSRSQSLADALTDADGYMAERGWEGDASA
jgi:hypothetical protein